MCIICHLSFEEDVKFHMHSDTALATMTVHTVTNSVLRNTVQKFIIRIASEKFSRYKLLGNEINEVNISLFGLNAFMIIRKTGSIKIIPRHSHKILFKTTVLFIPSFSTLHLYLPFSSNLKLNQCNNTYQ